MFGENSRGVQAHKEDVRMRGVSCGLLSMGNGGGALGLGGHTTSNIGPYRSEGSVQVTVVVEFEGSSSNNEAEGITNCQEPCNQNLMVLAWGVGKFYMYKDL